MVEHPSLGQHIDEVQIGAHAVIRAAIPLGSSTLRGLQYILPTLAHYRERGFLLQAAFVGRRDRAV